MPLKLAAGGSLGSLLPWGQGKSWIQMMALPHHNCVGLGKWLTLSRPCPSIIEIAHVPSTVVVMVISQYAYYY